MTTRSRPEIHLEHIEAIDMHVHVEVAADGSTSLPAVLTEAASRYFRSDGAQPDLDSIAQSYRAWRMAAVVFTVDARTQLGHQGVSSGEIIRRAADHADVLVPFASVDPHLGERAVDLVRGFAEQGARGFKFHPTLQGFDPSEDRYRPLWHAIAELALPAVVHTGQTGIGAGLPGGAGLKLRYSDPMLLDDVAAEEPDLTLILAHPSVPWQDEAISMATHKANVHIDLSGWSPKRIPPQLVRAAGSFLQDKVLFGSDFPLLAPERWLHDFASLDLPDAVRPKILKHNAARLLGLEGAAEPTRTQEKS